MEYPSFYSSVQSLTVNYSNSQKLSRALLTERSNNEMKEGFGETKQKKEEGLKGVNVFRDKADNKFVNLKKY